MKLEMFCLCDAATESAGKLNVLGAFDRIWAREAPVVYPQCAVAARLRFARIEEGTHTLRVTFADEDGRLVVPAMESGIQIRFGGSEVSAPINLIVYLAQLKLPRFGDYTVDLAVDAHHLGSLPLMVRSAAEHPSPAGPQPPAAG